MSLTLGTRIIGEGHPVYVIAASGVNPAGPVDEAGQVLTFNVTGNTNPALFSVAPTVLAISS